MSIKMARNVMILKAVSTRSIGKATESVKKATSTTARTVRTTQEMVLT